MARKSRKGIGGAAPAAEEKKQSGALPTAVYARLSVENSGKDDNGDSIENQIRFCMDFIGERTYLRLVDVYEDNGEKGTDFLRPQFERLMGDIRSGRIRCVVVKDLSRFGRNYIECGYYLEKIFPFLHVRFIAITDGFDSFSAGDAEKALMVPLKNMINAAYAKDISRKILSSFRARQDKGELLPNCAPYGYVKSKTRAYRFDPDPVAAPVVKKIFEWYAEGLSKNEIAGRLTEMGAVTPAMRKVQLGLWSEKRCKRCTWYGRSLMDILHNREYTGSLVYGRRKASLYEGIGLHKTSSDEWQVIPDVNEPLVSRELFEKAQERLERQKKEHFEKMEAHQERLSKQVNVLKGKIVCGDCGKNMRYRKSQKEGESPAYVCGGFVDSKGERCRPHRIVGYLVEEAVLKAVEVQLQAAADLEKAVRELKGGTGEKKVRDRFAERLREISVCLEEIEGKKTGLYEDMVSGFLNEEEYLYVKGKYEEEFRKLSLEMETVAEEKKSFEAVMELKTGWLKAVRELKGSRGEKSEGSAGDEPGSVQPAGGGLTREMAEVFVKKVRIFEGKKIEVELNFTEDMELMKKVLEEVSENV